MARTRRRWYMIAAAIITALCMGLLYKSIAGAATTVLVPDTDVTATYWTAGGTLDTTCAGGTLCDTVDEGMTDKDTDYINAAAGSNANSNAQFGLTTAANMDTATKLDVRIRAMAATVGQTLIDTVTVTMWIGGVEQTPTGSADCTPGNATWVNCTVTFNGTWSQSDVNSMEVRLVRNVLGSGGNPNSRADNTRVSNVYGTLTYTTVINRDQSSYRWFNNQGTPNTVNSSFAGKTDYSTNSGTYGVVAADFNNDGNIDLATANNTPGSLISVLMNNGNGTFATKVDYSIASNAYSISSADYNSDGRPDLAAVNYNSNSVSVLMNNGDGTFATKVDYTTGTNPYSVTSSDVNNDGMPDLAVANTSSSNVSILLNNGNGTFATKADYTTGSFPRSVVASDLNGDGKLDLAVASSGSNMASVLMNNGDGTFATKVDYTTGTNPYSVTSSDVNNDGMPDLAVANTSSSNVSILLNNGNGTFATKVDYTTGTSPESVTTGDFNGDGKPDLATANSGSSSVSVLSNNGNGTFATKVDYTTGTSPRSVSSADYNGDGKPDLATANSSFNNASVLPNTSTTNLDVGSSLASQNTATSTLGDGNIVRLRLNTHVSITSINAYQGSFKLRYAAKGGAGSCSAVASGSYADVTASTPIAYGDNPNAGNGLNLVTNANDPTHSTDTLVRQNYLEAGTATFSNSSAIPAGQDGMWDFALTTNAATPGNYCLKVTRSNGTDFSAYTVYPELTVPNPVLNQDSYRFYDNTNATSPGAALSANNAMANSRTATPFRLRLLLRQSAGTTANASAYKLQFAEKSGSCSASSYSDVPATAAPFGFNDNATPADDATITTTANDPTPSSGTVKPYTYNENNAFTMTSSLPAGQSGMWDFSLTTTVAADKKTYCLRTVTSGGSTLSAYTYYPEIYISDGPTLDQQMRGGQSVLNGSKTPYTF